MNKNQLLWAGAIASGVLLVALLGASHFLKPQPLNANGCGAEPYGKTVVVIDASDDVTAQTRKEIIVRVKDAILHKVKDGELVSVFTVNEMSKKNLVPLFAYCKPKRTGNELTENNRMLERNYVKKFERPLEAAVRAPTQSSKQSPIAQSLIDLSLSEFMRSEQQTHLLVFSDLMEFTEKFSLYGCSSGTKAASDFRQSRGAAVARPTFHNVDIELNIIPRPEVSAASGKCRDHFWTWFLGDNAGPGARLTPSDMPG
jgi:hypothetical protein